MSFLDHLNPEQREAVLHRDGPLLILAGAGSGKTRVICCRLAYLIGNGHADPEQVLAVTFTNKAAEEMRSRVEQLLESEYPRLWVSTFHSFCARLLRREGSLIGLSRDFVIYDSVDLERHLAFDQFADCTEDWQYIHVDPEKAAKTPFGTTIAHGFLTLSLLSSFWRQAVTMPARSKMTINYGLNRVRFPAPVPTGSRIRARFQLQSVSDFEGGVQMTWKVAVEVEDAPKPCLVAEWIVRVYR